MLAFFIIIFFNKEIRQAEAVKGLTSITLYSNSVVRGLKSITLYSDSVVSGSLIGIIGGSCHKYHFVATKVLSRQTQHVFCRNQSILSRQT